MEQLDRTSLVMLRIDLQSPNPWCIIDGSILVPFHQLSFPVFQLQELHIDLNMMPWNGFGIPLGVQSTFGSGFGQPAHSMSFQHSAHCGFGDLDPVVAVQIIHKA